MSNYLRQELTSYPHKFHLLSEHELNKLH